jgi:hypothetical protein
VCLLSECEAAVHVLCICWGCTKHIPSIINAIIKKFEASYSRHAIITAFGSDWHRFMGMCSIERNHFLAWYKFLTKYQHWTLDV